MLNPLLNTLLVVLLLPLTSAWVFTYRNGSNYATSFDDARNNKSCTKIDNPAGSKFEWEPQGGPWCLHLYTDTNCTLGGGHTCRGIDWYKESSKDLHSFEVQHQPPGYEDPTKQTSSTTSRVPATVTVTSTDPPTAAPVAASGRKALSGGGIAGVVIGVLAGVALFAALGFFLGKRAGRRQGGESAAAAVAAAAGGMQNGGGSADEPKPATSPASQTQALSPDSPVSGEQTYRPPGSRMVELVGNNGTSELSDTHRVMELDGSSTVKPPQPPYRG